MLYMLYINLYILLPASSNLLAISPVHIYKIFYRHRGIIKTHSARFVKDWRCANGWRGWGGGWGWWTRNTLFVTFGTNSHHPSIQKQYVPTTILVHIKCKWFNQSFWKHIISFVSIRFILLSTSVWSMVVNFFLCLFTKRRILSRKDCCFRNFYRTKIFKSLSRPFCSNAAIYPF